VSAELLLPYLKSIQPAKGAWDQLKTINAQSLNAKKTLLEVQLLRLSKAKTEDVKSYVSRAQKIRSELVAAGE
jgi:hypothetical protein